jgi:hypothetical protein
MRRTLIWLFNLAGNGVFMLAWPAVWYGLTPGVAETGPFNPHFARDVGGAYLVARRHGVPVSRRDLTAYRDAV